MAEESGEQRLIADRRRKLDRLREEFGIDPYGGRIDGLIPLREARDRYDPAADEAHKTDAEVDDRPRVRVAGRVVQHRVMGNLIFLVLRDATGDLQAAVSKKAVGQPWFSMAKALDYGDWAAVAGALGKTKTDEITVWAEAACGLAPDDLTTPDAKPQAAAEKDPLYAGFLTVTKSLTPPPGKYHGLEDPETRYRKRYIDLYSNPEVADVMHKRVRIIEEIRQYLRGRGFVEVETPMLQAIHGGAAARPFATHHNALDLPLTLRIAPELYLKRLLVGGFPKVFEINRNFRNEGISPRHNPEFTMLEAYESFGSWETMAELVEDMICTVAENVFGTLVIDHGGTEDTEAGGEEAAEGASAPVDHQKRIDLRGDQSKPRGQRWRRVRMDELVEEKTGWRFDQSPLPSNHPLAAELAPRSDAASGGAQSNAFANLSPAKQLVEVYEKLVEPTLINPTFVTHVPSQIIPLAKKNKDDPYFADVYELAINGIEISPGYSELNDPQVQEENFRHQVGDREEQQQVDEDFIEALRVGMPPAGGMGLGIDRLVMMLTGAKSIRDVILFPLMRPVGEGGGGTKGHRDEGT